MKLAKGLSYVLISLMLIPAVYALEMQNFFNVFKGIAEFFQNPYAQFFILIIGSGAIFGLIVYFGLMRTPIGSDNPKVAAILSLTLGLLATLPLLFAARNQNIVSFLQELFEGWYGFAVGITLGAVAFIIVYWVISSLWPGEGA